MPIICTTQKSPPEFIQQGGRETCLPQARINQADLEGLFPTAGFIIAVKNRYTRRLIVPDGKMNRSYAAKLAVHSLRCNHQKSPIVYPARREGI